MKIALIDSNYLCYRAFFTTPELKHGNIKTGIIFGFLNQLLNIGKSVKADQYVFVWDSKKSIRKNHCSFYKEKRKNNSDEDEEQWAEAFKQFNLLRKEILPEIGFQNLIQSGYEADDIIASIVQNNSDHEFIIVTNDDDLFQLLDYADIYNLGSNKFITKDSFAEEYGIEPSRWAEVKAVAGCSSDSIPGVQGVGEKKAISYLTGEMNPDSKIYRRIEDPKNEKFLERNRWLVYLPLPNTEKFEIQTDNAMDMRAFSRICKNYGIRKLINPDKYDEWEVYFS